MLRKIDPTQTQAWQSLNKQHQKMRSVQIKDLFAGNPGRFDRFSQKFEDILLDYSKNLYDEETFELLLKLAEEVDLKPAIEAMFSGQSNQ